MDVARQVLGILIVFGLLGAAVFLLGRRPGQAVSWFRLPLARRKAGRIELVERVPLSPQHALHLVRLGERALLVATHSGGCTVLERFDWHDAARQPQVGERGA